MGDLIELDARRHADDLRDTWQVRMLIYTRKRRIGAPVLSILAHSFDDAMPVILRIAFPGFESVMAPFICSCAQVAKTGAVVADVVWIDETIRKDCVIFKSLADMKDHLRHLADKMKLTDDERKEFFTVAKKWVVADRRRDPNMDPADPDSLRLTVH